MKKSTAFLFLLALLLYGFAGELKCQNRITSMHNSFQSDTIEKHGVGYLDTYQSGNDVLWDFTNVNPSKRCYRTRIKRDSTSVIMRVGKGGVLTFQEYDNAVFQTSAVTRLYTINYSQPVLCMSFPMEYGDTISCPFLGSGFYCQTLYYRERGVSAIVADAKGTIVLPSEDSVSNVLRLYKLKTMSVSMDADSSLLDTAQLKQVVEERYEWYARGCRYPIFESVTSTSYADMTPVGTTYESFCCLPEMQSMPNDSVNRLVVRRDSTERETNASHLRDNISYTIGMSNSNVRMQYRLMTEAHISVILCDAMGVVYKHAIWEENPGVDLEFVLNCDGLRQGQYIYYMNVNGKIYSEKLRIQ